MRSECVPVVISAALPPGFLQAGLSPIRLGDTRHPRHDRRDVSLRWLGATALLALAATAMLAGVLHGALRGAARLGTPDYVLAPAFARSVSADGRADRLRPRTAAPASVPSPLTTTVLRSSGLGDQPLTVLVADLGHMSALARTPMTPVDPDAPPDVVAHDQAPGLPPPLIRFGMLIPPQPAHLSSYAASGIAEPGPRGTALNVTVRPQSDPTPTSDRETALIAQRGDTMERLLQSFILPTGTAGELATALGVGLFGGGETVTLHQGGVGTADARRPPIVTLKRLDGSLARAALTDEGHYRAAVSFADEGTARPEPAGPGGLADDASVKESLDALTGHGGVGASLVANVVRVLGTDRDLGAAVSASDRIEVLYGAAPYDGSVDQELDFASLTAEGRATRLYRFAAADDNSVDYYDESGHSLTKFLMRKPVANGRLGDGFGWRIHPVLGDRRFHEGVDYAAPYGSPIVAAGAGVIEKIDYESGYGKYIRVRHDLGYETTYAHVAGYPRGIAVGRRVQQGETIAYVGSTGLSTGPHLYYEVKINDHNVDPTSIRIAAGRILEGASLAAFQRRRERIDTLLKAARNGAG